MKGLLGKKLGMMQLWNDNGQRIGVTAVKAGPCSVVQVKNNEKDGYSAVQIGFRETTEKHLTKPDKGHQKLSFEKKNAHFSKLIELRDYADAVQVGDTIDCNIFASGEQVMVRGISKGKGFQGVVKRYNFWGGRKTHGSTFHRTPGSIGAGTDPARVIKGKRMPGRMGGKKVTVKNAKIFKIVPEDNIILIEGSVPGPNGSPVFVFQK